MAYRRPAIEVIQEFQAAAAALALPTLPACVVGPGYQIADDVQVGVYSGTQTTYDYVGLADGALVDLTKAPATEAELNVWKPVGVALADAYVQVKTPATTGAVNPPSASSAFTDATSGAFAALDPVAKQLYLQITGPVHAKSTGSITAIAKASLVDAETFTLNDGTNAATVFEFDTNSSVLGGHVAVDISAATTDADVATAIRSAINGVGAGLAITASGTGALVVLTNDAYGVAGNHLVTTTVADAGFLLAGMANGADGLAPADVGRKRIVSKGDANTLRIAGEFVSTTSVSSVAYSVLEYRASEVYSAVPGTALTTGVQLPDNMPSATDALPVIEANVRLSWRALRPDLASSINAFTDIDSLKAIFGVNAIVPTNIGAYAVNLALQNTTTEVSFTGMSADFYSAEETAWQTAFSYLEAKDVYALAILSHNPLVQQDALAHVEGMSVSTVGRERVCFISRKLSSVAVITPASGLGYATGGALTSTPADHYRTLRDSGATFITDGVHVGQYLEISDMTVGSGSLTSDERAYMLTTRHKVLTVDSENQLTLVADPAHGHAGGLTLTAIHYRVTRDMTRNEEAAFLGGYSSTFNSRRVVATWPDVLAVSLNSVATKVPGYFAGAVLAGMTAGLPSQTGFTNLTVTGFVGREHSDDRYNDTQLDTIAGGGTLIFTQPVPEAALSIRHQLTTNLTTIKFQEFSITKNLDMISRFLRGIYKPYLGIYNITSTLLDLLKTKGESAATFLLAQRAPRVGAPVRSMSLSRIEESATQPDSVEIDHKVDVPLPLNNLKVTLLV